MMNPLNLAKVEAAKKAGGRQVGTIYKRTRADGPNGEKVQRAEIRFDDVAGCLRTPTGGSSRQTIMVIEGKRVRRFTSEVICASRLLSPREAARLMGLPDTYALPKNYNDAYHLAGDGVAVPVVRFLAEHILEPLLAAAKGVLTKKRYRLRHENHDWELDEFLGPLCGLWLAEIELKESEESFAQPNWIGKEVTNDHRYSNANLAEHGIPSGDW